MVLIFRFVGRGDAKNELLHKYSWRILIIKFMIEINRKTYTALYNAMLELHCECTAALSAAA